MFNENFNEERECPICLEKLESDDLYFYPCECKYQFWVCRFCWHRIRNDENGLCPACRRQYKENSLSFQPPPKPTKPKRKRKDRKEKEQTTSSDTRKHLADIRVLQRNLVYVVGLPSRISQADLLQGSEFFGRYGKVIKVIVGTLPSNNNASKKVNTAYVTYAKEDDALRAIYSTSNLCLDGKWIKTTLGTTKYCSNYLKNMPCLRSDCMYLHDIAPPDLSFSKEDMQVNKHLNYEQRLIEEFVKRNYKCHEHQKSLSLPSADNASPHSNTTMPLKQVKYDLNSTVSALDFPSFDQDPVNIPSPNFDSKLTETTVPFAKPSSSVEPLMNPELENKDNDLDFDPFSEAMRGLEELLNEAERCDSSTGHDFSFGSAPPKFSPNNFTYTSFPIHYGPPPGFSNGMNPAFSTPPPGFFNYPPMLPSYTTAPIPTSSNYYAASPMPPTSSTRESYDNMIWRPYISRLL